MAAKTKITIRYVSGREDQFEVEIYGGGKSAEFRLKEFVKDPTLLLQTESELILIPAAAIECVTIALPESDTEQLSLPKIRKAQRSSSAANRDG
jgi:hypothetical protein